MFTSLKKCCIMDNIEKALKEIEEDTKRKRYLRGGEYFPIMKKLEESGEKERLEEIRTEAIAMDLITHGDSFEGYFQPVIAYTDGSTSPPRDYFTKGRFDHLKKRALEIKNPIHASKYADVVWDLGKKKDIEMARVAIDQYLLTLKIYRENGWGVEFGRDAKRLTALACEINDRDRMQKAKETLLQFMKELNEIRNYRFCIDIAQAFIDSKTMKFEDNEISFIFTIMVNAIEYYNVEHDKDATSFGPVDGPNEHFVRMFHELKYKLIGRFKKDDEKTLEQKAIGESYEREASLAYEAKEYLRAHVFLTKAEEVYNKANLKEDRDRVRVFFAELGPMVAQEMEEHKFELKITSDEIDEYVKPFIAEDISESLKRLSTYPHFIPSVRDIEKNVNDRMTEHPLIRIIPTRTLTEDGREVSSPQSDEEIVNDQVVGDLVQYIQISTIYMSKVYDKLIEQQSLDTAKLVDHFRQWGYCNEPKLTLLKEGFQYHLSGDYVAALHILVPQYEAILRQLLHAAGRPVEDVKKVYSLGTLLYTDKVFEKAAGSDLHTYIKVVMIDQRGLNLRNDLAHGILSNTAMNKSTSELIIYLLLTLTRFRVGITGQ